MKKASLILTIIVFTIGNTIYAQLNQTGTNFTNGSVGVRNPNNTQAVSFLDWQNDTARLRVGGSGVGAENGFQIVGPGNKNWFKILGNGNIGIGTTGPTAKLHVDGDIRANSEYILTGIGKMTKKGTDFNFWSVNNMSFGTNYDNTKMTILKSGNIGIGTTSPTYPLHVHSDNHFQLRLEGKNGKHSWMQFIPSGSNVINWQAGANTNGFSIYDTTNKKYRLTVSNTGNVGIGKTNPSAPLDVNGNAKIGDNNWAGLTLDGKGDNNWTFNAHNDSNSLHIRTQNDGGVANSKYLMSIKRDNGNVGIGTTNPTQKLEVRGVLKVSNGIHSSIIIGNEINDRIIADNGNGTYGKGYFFRVHDEALTHKYRDVMMLSDKGNVGIATKDTKGFRLGVNGKIAATEVKVALYDNWPDYVFTNEYKLPTLKEVENHIQEKGHLQNIPSAKEVKENEGFFLGDMNAKLLQKIEELTLYTIQQEKKLEVKNSEVKELQEKMELLLKRLEKLEASK